MTKERIVLKGHEYATPKTESVEIINQGVLCASAGGGGGLTSKGGFTLPSLGSKTLG